MKNFKELFEFKNKLLLCIVVAVFFWFMLGMSNLGPSRLTRSYFGPYLIIEQKKKSQYLIYLAFYWLSSFAMKHFISGTFYVL